jgi:hypothetical protein
MAEILIRMIRRGARVVEFPTLLESRVLGVSKMRTVRTIAAPEAAEAPALRARARAVAQELRGRGRRGPHARARTGGDAMSAPATNGRPLLSVSLDADNLWSYMKTHGDAGWQAYPTYLGKLADVALARLAKHSLKITFFIVGQDAALPRNRAALAAIAAAGHDVGNHSFRHEPWLHEYSPDEVFEEIRSAEEAIEAATGVRTKGFRGPASASPATCCRSSPTVATPTTRAPSRPSSGRSPASTTSARRATCRPRSAAAAASCSARSRDGLRPLHPYVWTLRGGELLEIPSRPRRSRASRCTSPTSCTSPSAARRSRAPTSARRSAPVAPLRGRAVAPAALAHFLGGDDVAELAFFPGMRMPAARKLAVFDWLIEHLHERFELVSLDHHARVLLDRDRARAAATSSCTRDGPRPAVAT